MNRFGDIDASFKRLPPLYGYRSEKLISIEQALKPIEPEIDELPYYIKIAKKNCHFPSKHGLSKDQSAAVYIYTMEWGDTALYRVLNQALRSENRQALKIWFPYLKLFDTALDKLPVIKEVVWRGVPLDIGKGFTKNQILTWWSVNSCSSSVNVIKDFLKNDKNATLFLIEVINGIKISGYTEYELEDEVILRMGTQFRVKSNALDHPNGSHIVHLIEINDEDDDDDDKPVVPGKNETHQTTIPSNPDVPEIKSSAYVSKDVQPKEKPDLPKVDAVSNEKLDDNDMLKLILDEIINILDLDGSEGKDEIINDLLINGRQSLKKYEEYIIPDIYKTATNGNDNELMKHLRSYFEQQWKTQYSDSNKWFIQLLNEYKLSENQDLYKQVLTRTAEYGNKFLKDCPVLSIILQLLFEGIDDYYLIETNIFNELWFTITNDGLQSIRKYSDYIVEDVMNEQINKKQSILFQTLREYYRQDLFQLLQQSNIVDKQNLYDLALDNVAEFGWKIGLQAIQKKTIPKNYKILLEKLDSFLQQQQNVTTEIKNNVELIETTAKTIDMLQKQDPEIKNKSEITTITSQSKPTKIESTASYTTDHSTTKVPDDEDSPFGHKPPVQQVTHTTLPSVNKPISTDYDHENEEIFGIAKKQTNVKTGTQKFVLSTKPDDQDDLFDKPTTKPQVLTKETKKVTPTATSNNDGDLFDTPTGKSKASKTGISAKFDEDEDELFFPKSLQDKLTSPIVLLPLPSTPTNKNNVYDDPLGIQKPVETTPRPIKTLSIPVQKVDFDNEDETLFPKKELNKSTLKEGEKPNPKALLVTMVNNFSKTKLSSEISFEVKFYFQEKLMFYSTYFSI